MKFERVRPADAIGAVLAHGERIADGVLKKGRVLDAEDTAALAAAGLDTVVVARLESGDVGEDPAAERLAAAIRSDPCGAALRLTAPTAGRVNLVAASDGVLRVSADRIAAVNAVDEAITVATLPPFARVRAGALAATIKIIPYAVDGAALSAAERAASGGGVALHPFSPKRVALIQTGTAALKPTVLTKGAGAVRARVAALGSDLVQDVDVPHAVDALAAAISSAPGDLVLVLTASATSDRRDVCPAAIEAAGGSVARVGMPVDPGNLLVLGAQGGRPVVGLPGCARSPALNGADWVLDRLAADLPIDADDVAAMGVGGLLKEIPSRPQPRAALRTPGSARAAVSAILLAAGGSRRMGEGRHKLLEAVDGEPLVRRTARRLLDSPVAETVAVLGARASEVRAALDGLPIRIVEAARWREGVAESLKAGLAAASPTADAALVALADMPNVDADLVRRVLDAFDPAAGAEIVRPEARTADGERAPGHPVLFGRRFFEALQALEGDVGARAVVAAHRDRLRAVPLDAADALLDLDTPEQWAAFRSGAA